MPILAGYSAAKQLDVNGMLGAFIGCILMSPDFAAIASAGTPFDVYGIPCTVTTYSQTVLPVMLSVPVFCLIYKIIKKYMPDVITTVFTPFLSILISLPFILCLLAPLGTIVGNLISNGLAWFGMNTGFFGVAVIAALWEFLVMSGYAPGPDDAHDGRLLRDWHPERPHDRRRLRHLGLLRRGSGRCPADA